MKKEDFDKKVKEFVRDLLKENNVFINFRSEEYTYGSIYKIDLRVNDYPIPFLEGEKENEIH